MDPYAPKGIIVDDHGKQVNRCIASQNTQGHKQEQKSKVKMTNGKEN